MRRGCIILIIIACLILQVISVLFFIFVWPEKKKRGTSQTIYVVEKCLEDFKRDHKAYPKGGNREITEALYGQNSREKVYLIPSGSLVRDGLLCDFYKQPLRFEFPDENTVEVVSSGPDKEFDTADDITSDLIHDVEEDLPKASDQENGEGTG